MTLKLKFKGNLNQPVECHLMVIIHAMIKFKFNNVFYHLDFHPTSFLFVNEEGKLGRTAAIAKSKQVNGADFLLILTSSRLWKGFCGRIKTEAVKVKLC